MLFRGSLTVIFLVEHHVPLTRFSPRSVIRNPVFCTHLVLSGFVPGQNQLTKLQLCSQTATRHGYYLLSAVFLRLLDSLIVWLLKSVVTAAKGKTLAFWFPSLNSDAEQMRRVCLSLQEEEKKRFWGFWAAIRRLLPLISSDRTNNATKRRRSIRPSTCQAALDHIHVEDGRQIRPLAHAHSCQTTRRLTQNDVEARFNCFLDSPNAFRNSTCIWRNVRAVVWWWIRKSPLQILDRPDTRWNVFLCSIYWSNIQKKYTKTNHSNLALLKSHINRNIPTSFQSFGVTETAERPEPAALKSPARHPEEGSVASCLGSLHRHTATISTSSWRKRHFFFLCWFCFFFFSSFQQTVLSDEEGWDAHWRVVSHLVKKWASSSSSNLKTKVKLLLFWK